MSADSSPDHGKRGHASSAFARTRWSLVMAVRGASGLASERTLGDLCRDYWYPVYAYVRRCGHAPPGALELTGRFFGVLHDAIRRIDPAESGRFRAFLLSQLHRFLADPATQPAGPGPAPPVPLAALELRLAREHAPGAPPDQVFQRGFAIEVLSRALARLRNEAEQSGRGALFRALEPYLVVEPPAGEYEALAAKAGTSGLAMLVALKRLRQRFRELVDHELGETVASSADLEAERASLLAVLEARA